jgi:hypothetical protein
MRRTLLFPGTIGAATTALLVPAMLAQNFVMVTATGASPVNLTQRTAATTFIASNADNANIFKDVAQNQVQTSILTTVAGSIMKLPVVGPFGTLVWAGVFGNSILHRGGSSTKGFNVTYIQGLSASVAIAPGSASLSIPAQTLQSSGAETSALVLLRLRPSVKDSARIVRSTHVVIKQTKSTINPMSTEVLGTEQDLVSSKTETVSGNVIVTPDGPLRAGEYALVAPAGSAAAGALLAWDFKVR